jgi:trans-aconitate 2-methyltransferase
MTASGETAAAEKPGARAATTDWSADLYLRFADERTRPSRDLLAAVPLRDADRVVDLGCGPGNSTELLVARFPDAAVSGLDSSPAMVEAARRRLPGLTFFRADVATWTPEPDTNLLFANAMFQWVPDREAVLARLVAALPEDGVLAVQMPDNNSEPSHVAMDTVARAGPWASRLAAAQKGALLTPEGYYDLLKPLCRRVDIWRTTYEHVLDGPAAIAEWFMATGLRPFLSPLEKAEQDEFIARYVEELAKGYPPRADGKVLLHFPRLFFVATR